MTNEKTPKNADVLNRKKQHILSSSCLEIDTRENKPENHQPLKQRVRQIHPTINPSCGAFRVLVVYAYVAFLVCLHLHASLVLHLSSAFLYFLPSDPASLFRSRFNARSSSQRFLASTHHRNIASHTVVA